MTSGDFIDWMVMGGVNDIVELEMQSRHGQCKYEFMCLYASVSSSISVSYRA